VPWGDRVRRGFALALDAINFIAFKSSSLHQSRAVEFRGRASRRGAACARELVDVRAEGNEHLFLLIAGPRKLGVLNAAAAPKKDAISQLANDKGVSLDVYWCEK
jgi:hypothetical protein